MRLAVHHRSAVNHAGVPLQVFLTCNAYFSFTMFVVILWYSYAYKLAEDPPLWDVDATWYGSLAILWTVMEPVRIYLGYTGNLKSSVSALCGFIMLTITGQIALMIVFMILMPRQGSADFGTVVVQLCLAALELVYSFRQLKIIVRNSTFEFYVFLGMRLED